MSERRIRFGAVVATAVVALTLGGCAAPATGGANPGGGETGASTPADPAASAPAEAQQPPGEIDCGAVRTTLVAWLEASFAGISTEITNAELAGEYVAAADAHAAATVPGAAQWDLFGEILDEYVSQWSALPAEGKAIEHIETVEAHVDAFAESRGFDNDDFDDLAPIVGEQCADVLDDLVDG